MKKKKDFFLVTISEITVAAHKVYIAQINILAFTDADKDGINIKLLHHFPSCDFYTEVCAFHPHIGFSFYFAEEKNAAELSDQFVWNNLKVATDS